MRRSEPKSAGLADQQDVAVGILDANLSLGHVLRIGNGRDLDALGQEVIAESDKIGRVEVEKHGLLAGDDRVGGLGKHEFGAFALNVCPDRFSLGIIKGAAHGEAEQGVKVDGAL